MARPETLSRRFRLASGPGFGGRTSDLGMLSHDFKAFSQAETTPLDEPKMNCAFGRRSGDTC
jgi:hypothetical protein